VVGRLTSADIRCLIREMSVANPLWEAPRIHGLAGGTAIFRGDVPALPRSGRRLRPPCPTCRNGGSAPIFILPWDAGEDMP
jgi:hypothetical protein